MKDMISKILQKGWRSRTRSWIFMIADLDEWMEGDVCWRGTQKIPAQMKSLAANSTGNHLDQAAMFEDDLSAAAPT